MALERTTNSNTRKLTPVKILQTMADSLTKESLAKTDSKDESHFQQT